VSTASRTSPSVAGKLVAVTWTEKAQAVMAVALSTLAMVACGRPWW
jgi:hypothetical protein